MAMNLTKHEVTQGQRINLTKNGDKPITKAYAGAGWDATRYDGAQQIDIDLYAFLLNENGKCISPDYFIAGGGPRAFTKENGDFYDHDPERAVIHNGDNTTGIGDGDDESLNINFTKLNPAVTKIVCIAAIYDAAARGQKFGMIDNAFFHVTNMDTGDDYNYDLSEDYDQQTAIVGVEIYKHNGQWKLKAVGEGYVKDVLQLCTEYGLDASYEN